METEVIHEWYQIGDTKVYTTGHYQVSKAEVKALFEKDVFPNGNQMAKVNNDEIVIAELEVDTRIVFYFFPLKKGKYLMEGNAKQAAVDTADKFLPEQLQEILVDRRRIRYH